MQLTKYDYLISEIDFVVSYATFVRTLVMLYFVGLGLADETDITVKGLAIVKKADRVYLEAYTSILLVDRTRLVSALYFEKGFLQYLLINH